MRGGSLAGGNWRAMGRDDLSSSAPDLITPRRPSPSSAVHSQGDGG